MTDVSKADRLAWQPEASIPPLEIELAEYFSHVLGD